MRKGQLEIMGLAIIIVIIIFGILLSLIFLRPKESSLKPDLTDSTLASNMIDVILKTTLDCKDIELKSLLQDCAEGVVNKEYCSATDKDSCGKVTRIINESILQKTLDIWKKKYTFRASVIGGQEDLIEITNTPIVNGKIACDQDSQKYLTIISESYHLPLGNGKTMEITLYICR